MGFDIVTIHQKRRHEFPSGNMPVLTIDQVAFAAGCVRDQVVIRDVVPIQIIKHLAVKCLHCVGANFCSIDSQNDAISGLNLFQIFFYLLDRFSGS